MVRIERGDGMLMQDRLDDLLAIYRAAFLDIHEADPARAAEERRAIMFRHAERTGLDLRVAVDDDSDPVTGELLGFCYAYHGIPGQWWHDIVAAQLSADAARQWLADCREIVELHVRPERQGHGLGRALLRAVLAPAAERTAVLSALDDPASRTDRARRLYASENFVELLSGFRFPGSPLPYAVLGRPLPRADEDRAAGAEPASRSR